MNDVKYFYKGISILGGIFHAPDFETALEKIEGVYTELKVGMAATVFSLLIVVSTIAAFLMTCGLIICGTLVLLLVIPMCIWLRNVLYNYVDLRIKVDGHEYKLVSCGISQRQKLYEIEDYFKNIQCGCNS